jgi:hypothetical protein
MEQRRQSLEARHVPSCTGGGAVGHSRGGACGGWTARSIFDHLLSHHGPEFVAAVVTFCSSEGAGGGSGDGWLVACSSFVAILV